MIKIITKKSKGLNKNFLITSFVEISGGSSNPGIALIPTKSIPKPLSYFKAIPQDRLRVGDNYVAFKIDVDDIYKLAIRPEDIDFSRKAKIGYVLKIPESEEYGFHVKLLN